MLMNQLLDKVLGEGEGLFDLNMEDESQESNN